MHFSSLLSVSAVLYGLVSVVSALPAASSIGAHYFMSNKPDNTIVVSNINPDGSLTFAHEVLTGGQGTPKTGSDPLASQNSVIVSGGVYSLLEKRVNASFSLW